MRAIVIMGAGGRDFHDFNTVFRDDPAARVVAFTAAQIPGIADVFRAYPTIGRVLPAMGYGQRQVEELRAIEAADCDVVVAGTPIDLRRVVRTRHPVRQARYELRELGSPTLAEVLAPVVELARGKARAAATPA
jgi:predicted GTPase